MFNRIFTSSFLFTLDKEVRYENFVRLRKFALPGQRIWWLILFDKYWSPSKLGTIRLKQKTCEGIYLPRSGAERRAHPPQSTLKSQSTLTSCENVQLNRHVYAYVLFAWTHVFHWIKKLPTNHCFVFIRQRILSPISNVSYFAKLLRPKTFFFIFFVSLI